MKNTPEIRFKGFTDAWVQRRLGEVADIVRGASPRPIQDPKWFDDNSDIGWLRISDVTEQNGRIYYLDQKISEAGQSKTRVLTEPHLLLSIAATIGRPVINYIKTGVHDGFLIFLNPKFEQEFMFQWFEMFRLQWQQYGQPGSQVNLNSDLVKTQEILLPLSEEQTSIGNFFHILDDTILLYKRKLDSLKQLKKAYLQQMFPQEREAVPRIRFSGFKGDWREYILEHYFKERSERSSVGELISVTINYGVMKADELDRQIISSEDKSNYKIVKVGDIAYNSMRMWQGASGYSSYDGILSPAYTVLTPNSNTYSQFFAYLFKRLDMIQIFQRNSQGLTSDTWNLKFSAFSQIKVRAPLYEEQIMTADFFKKLDFKITKYSKKIEQLQRLKSAYLQKMFV